jgi:transcriptional regulator with XRE-family HTH domain
MTTGGRGVWELGDFLRAIKQEKGLSQWELSKAMDIQPGQISLLLNDKRTPAARFEYIVRACKAFNLSLPTVLRMGGMSEADIQAILQEQSGVPEKRVTNSSGRRGERVTDEVVHIRGPLVPALAATG